MTEQQWYYLIAQISSLRTLLLAVVRTLPDQELLKQNWMDQKNLGIDSLLHLSVSDSNLERIQAEIERLEQALWGQAPPPPLE